MHTDIKATYILGRPTAHFSGDKGPERGQRQHW
jgi:hypothetical protein